MSHTSISSNRDNTGDKILNVNNARRSLISVSVNESLKWIVNVQVNSKRANYLVSLSNTWKTNGMSRDRANTEIHLCDHPFLARSCLPFPPPSTFSLFPLMKALYDRLLVFKQKNHTFSPVAYSSHNTFISSATFRQKNEMALTVT